MHIHFDALGGISGDMFIASLLDAQPALQEPVLRFLASLPLPMVPPMSIMKVEEDEVLPGLRFCIGDTPVPEHDHTTWKEIRQWLLECSLPTGIIHNALGIFEVLAKAEAGVHRVKEDSVMFHEVGALDSIIDILGAAYLIDYLNVEHWSVSSLPIGSGRIRSAHGVLPVPAPATSLLLEGYLTHDDGIEGERVTPTGAAILRWLKCTQTHYQTPRRLVRSGVGLGSRRLVGVSNCLRTLCFEPLQESPMQSEIIVIEFEVDDQSPEDLAIGLDRLRALEGVVDVSQLPAYGKKGRLGVHVHLLALPGSLSMVTNACFIETTTIGLRYRTEQRLVLPRVHAKSGEKNIRTKIVERPGSGRTAKADIGDVAESGGHQARIATRRTAEEAALISEETPAS